MNNIHSNETERDDGETKPEVTLDSIFVTDIGQFGKFQIKTMFLGLIIVIFAACAETEYVFTAARIDSRCRIMECDEPQPEWSPYWLPNAVPTIGLNSFDNCQRFSNTSSISRQVESDTCPSTLFDRSILQPCEEYVYENTDTVAYDFGLACDEWSRTLIGTIRTVGTFAAQPITGYISDRWGRRVALVFNAFNTGWMGVVRYWSNTYIGFMASEIIEAIFGSGAYAAFYILVIELTGPKYRVVSGACVDSSFAIGSIVLGLLAWGLPNWRNLTLALYIPQLFTIFYFWLITDSVRWYMSKCRFKEADALFKKIAKTNGKTVSEKSLKILRDKAVEEAKIKTEEKETNQEPWLIVQILQHKRILLRVIISPVWWITTTFIYYGLSVNAVNILGNSYLNFVAVAAVEIPGYWTAVFLMGKIGRKPVLIGAFWSCAICQIAYIFIPSDLYGVSLTVYLIAKFSIASVMTSIYIYTSELYPTKRRHSLFAFSSMMGRIGSVLAPLTPAIGAQWFEELPFVLFASLALLSGALVFLTPETFGCKLPETFEEASQIGVKAKKQQTVN